MALKPSLKLLPTVPRSPNADGDEPIRNTREHLQTRFRANPELVVVHEFVDPKILPTYEDDGEPWEFREPTKKMMRSRRFDRDELEQLLNRIVERIDQHPHAWLCEQFYKIGIREKERLQDYHIGVLSRWSYFTHFHDDNDDVDDNEARTGDPGPPSTVSGTTQLPPRAQTESTDPSYVVKCLKQRLARFRSKAGSGERKRSRAEDETPESLLDAPPGAGRPRRRKSGV